MSKRLPTPEAPEPEDDGSEVNTIYGDLITFIMCLFILLFVITYNENKDANFLTQLQMKFGGKEERMDNAATAEGVLVTAMKSHIKKEHLEDQVQVIEDQNRVKLIFHTPVLFGSGKATVKPEGRRVLEGFEKIFYEVKNPIMVEGHTDNVPINNEEFGSNWELSFFRAFNVIRVFMGSGNFLPKQLSAKGYGEYQPVTSNGSIIGRAQNRRIEINVMKSEDGPQNLDQVDFYTPPPEFFEDEAKAKAKAKDE
ncbi:MAG: chemotaxis protein MotB [Candidatus Marinamargulisbacteria bacterium]